MTRSEPQHRLFLQWLLFAGILVFAIWLANQQQLLGELLERDPTKLSLVIELMFVAATVHCGVRAWYLSSQLNYMRAIRLASEDSGQPPVLVDEQLRIGDEPLATSLPAGYFAAILTKYGDAGPDVNWRLEHAQLTEVLAEQARGQHETGWFITGMLIKLGLIGTVIGFVLMLASVSQIESFDIADVQNVLQQMTVGMGVALYTTLVGLVGSMLLGMQYLMLDRGADRLVADAVHFAEVSLLREAPPERDVDPDPGSNTGAETGT